MPNNIDDWKLSDEQNGGNGIWNSRVSIQTVIIVATILLLVIWRFVLGRRNDTMPPGPKGLPVVGYLPFLGGENRFSKIISLSKQYEGIFSIRMGTRPVVFLNDWDTIKDTIVKRGDIFSGRPHTIIFEKGYDRQDIGTSDGPVMKEQRRFALHQLRNFGFGKKSLDDIVMVQVESVIRSLEEKIEKGKMDVNISNLFFIPVMNVIWGIVSGQNYSLEDEHMSSFAEILKLNFQFISAGNVANFIPILRFFPSSKFNLFLSNTKTIKDFLLGEVADHEKSFDENNCRDFIDVYLKEILSRSENERRGTAFEKSRLVGTLANLFQGGIDTTGDTLCWLMLYMATWPEIQNKVEKELEDVIGKHRFPTYEDRVHLPYTEAVIFEAQRMATTVPFGIPHAPLKTVEVNGYKMPKGTYTLQNIYGVHHDARLWGDPELFRPERFLDEQGAIHKPEYFIPYAVGPRSCLGESLARVELFLFFTCMMQKFNFSYVTGKGRPSMSPLWAVTLRPPSFSLHVTPRDS